MTEPIVIRAERWLDVKSGEMNSPAVLVVEENRIAAIGSSGPASPAREIDLGDATLLPGLMDMELNFFIGGPENPDGLPNPLHGVQDDPAYRTLRSTVNAKATLLAGFTTVRNLGLMVKTGGYILDVSLGRAIDRGWVDGPRIVAAGHAISPSGGHLDPTMVRALAPSIMPLSVEEGIANGVPEVQKAVRYQIKHGAGLIKISASGGVMSYNSSPGSQQYSDEELEAIVDEAHRAGLRVAAHGVGDVAIRACIRAGVDCIEHGFLASEDTIEMMVEHGTFLVSTQTLCGGMALSKADPVHQQKAAEVFPKARDMLPKAIKAGVKIALGTDAPAIPHGSNARELATLVERGMTPLQALQAATITSADLIDVDDRGRLEPGLLADVIAVPGNPLEDITVAQDMRFVMKDGRIYKGATA
jgi:imidazolonepropionase-like amidohydrolase